MNNPWVLLVAGFLFCYGGAFLFHRNFAEEDKRVFEPFLVMIAGVLLIALATAKFYHLIK